MDSAAMEGLRPVGARLGDIEAIAVTTSSAVIDLQTRTNVFPEIQAGRFIILDADGADVYYAFNSENGGTIDDTNTTAGNQTQCARVPAGMLLPIRVPHVTQAQVNASAGAITTPGACRYLLVKATVACKLRIYVATEAANNRLGGG